MIQEITPSEALDKQSKGAVIVDVREPWELAIANINGTINIPMNTIPNHLDQLNDLAETKALLIMCHHGRRSLSVAHYLIQQGFDTVYNITGGCDAWSLQVNSQLPRY